MQCVLHMRCVWCMQYNERLPSPTECVMRSLLQEDNLLLKASQSAGSER